MAATTPAIAHVSWDTDDDTWRNYLSRCDQATFFHTPGWYRTHEARVGLAPHAAHFRFTDGCEALLPFAVGRRFRGLVTEARAGIESGYGGLVSADALSSAHVEAAYRAMRERFPDVSVAGNPHARWTDAFPGATTTHSATQLIAVRDRDAQLKAMNAKRAARVRKAAKQGFALTVVPAPGYEDVARFYPLYAAHAAKWRETRWLRDEAYFEALLHHAGRELVLFLVHHEGELAGFRLLGIQGAHGLGLHLAASERHEPMDVGPFMIAETLGYCFDHGVTTFDFLPSGALAGVVAYKASFGAVEAPMVGVSAESWLGRGLSAARGRFKGAAMPRHRKRLAVVGPRDGALTGIEARKGTFTHRYTGSRIGIVKSARSGGGAPCEVCPSAMAWSGTIPPKNAGCSRSPWARCCPSWPSRRLAGAS